VTIGPTRPDGLANPKTAISCPRSLPALIGLTLLDVSVALLLAFGVVVIQAALTSPNPTWGTLLPLKAAGLPLDKLGLQDRLDRAMTWHYTMSAHCVTIPAEDTALRGWLRGQSDLGPFIIRHERLPLPQPQDVGDIDADAGA
jgi:hypothetical protein